MKKRYFKGSLTIEAAGVMAVLLFGLGTVIMEAGRIHDEVTGAMVIHEAVEKSRHEKELDLKEAASFFQANRGARLRLSGYRVYLMRTEKLSGAGQPPGTGKRKFRDSGFVRRHFYGRSH